MSTKNPLHALLATSLLLFLAAPAVAQEKDPDGYQEFSMDEAMEAYMKAGMPNEHHQALAAMAGEWTAEIRMFMDPTAEEPMLMESAVTSEMIMDGRFYRETVTGSFMGMPFHGEFLCTYNNTTGEYEATWIDNMSTSIHRYTGSMDGDKLILEGGFDDPLTGDWIATRSIRTLSGDTMVEVGYETRGDTERKTMEITYTRKM